MCFSFIIKKIGYFKSDALWIFLYLFLLSVSPTYQDDPSQKYNRKRNGGPFPVRKPERLFLKPLFPPLLRFYFFKKLLTNLFVFFFLFLQPGRELYVKWKGLSYLHCQWVQEAQVHAAQPALHRCFIRRMEQGDEEDAAAGGGAGAAGEEESDDDDDGLWQNGAKVTWMQVQRIVKMKFVVFFFLNGPKNKTTNKQTNKQTNKKINFSRLLITCLAAKQRKASSTW